jgi:hypothetical protein
MNETHDQNRKAVLAQIHGIDEQRVLIDAAMFTGASEYEDDKTITPVITCIRDDTLHVVPVHDCSKDAIVAALTAMHRAGFPVCFMAETWTVTRPRTQSPALYEAIASGSDAVTIPPDEHPDRKHEACIQFRFGDRTIIIHAAIENGMLGPWHLIGDTAAGARIYRTAWDRPLLATAPPPDR